MKVEANSIEQLIELAGPRAAELRSLDAFIVESAPDLKRQLFAGPSITMIGYGEMTWKTMSVSGIWPLLGVAPQKRYVSLYVAADRESVPLTLLYKDRIGHVTLGKNCIRFTRFDRLNLEELRSFIRDVVAWGDAQPGKYGRDCARPIS